MPTRSTAPAGAHPDPLGTYRAKRDFARTPEPRGEAPPKASKTKLRFVVQKHDASRLHFDFRLELGGVLKSWAVTRGPSLHPGDKRLAVEVEDHPLEYRDFEGVIGAGYGAGTVMLWDEGRWEPAPEVKDPAEAIKDGNLKFVLHGKRLRGGWDLVRMKPRARERTPQWLLIKRRDEEARPGEGETLVAEETTSIRSGRTMEEIAGCAAPRKPAPKQPSRRKVAANVPEREQRATQWLETRLAAEIDYTGRTAEGLLRQPSFRELREDKPAAEVTVPVKEAAPAPSRPSSQGTGKGQSSVRGVALSHPEKPFWPADGITKHDLAEYYAAAADRLLRHAGGRPLSLVRAPDGIDGPRFFQRNAMRGTSHLLRLVHLKGMTKPLLAVESAEGFVALAQMGVLEIHPWGSRLGDEERPDRVVFDLDPAEDVPFAKVTEAVLELRAVLEGKRLAAFPKTTGGKGMHVVVPLRPDAAWEEARQFTKDICERIASDAPDRFTTSMSKQARTGRIFLDYLRNDRGATAVAPWSPRARPGATIAMPLSWNELGPALDPSRFTIAAASSLLRRRDPWEGFNAAAGALPKSP